MAVMNDPDRVECWAEQMRVMALTGLTKAQFRAAVDAIDQWISDNAILFNTAIPQPARTALSSAQKAQLLAAVALKRYVKGV